MKLIDFKNIIVIICGLVAFIGSIYTYLIPTQPGDYRMSVIVITFLLGTIILIDKCFDVFVKVTNYNS